MARKERNTAGQKMRESLPDVRLESGTQVPSADDKARYRQRLSDQYIGLLKSYMKDRNLRESPLLVELVSDFAELSFSAKEILDLHTEAIDRVTHNMRPADVERLVNQSRYLLLGVMMHLMELYRQRS